VFTRNRFIAPLMRAREKTRILGSLIRFRCRRKTRNVNFRNFNGMLMNEMKLSLLSSTFACLKACNVLFVG
jgi:hypothetical protein